MNTTLSLTSGMVSCKPMMSRSLSFKRQRPVFSCRVRARAADLYQVLALTPDTAGPLEVKRAYRSMARKYHPDACHDPSLKEEATRMFLQLHEAYETLSDPVLREEYDYKLGAGSCRPVLRRTSSGNRFSRRRWEEQIVELHKRCKQGKGKREGSWGSRMRARNEE